METGRPFAIHARDTEDLVVRIEPNHGYELRL